jgi:hypothetical protein
MSDDVRPESISEIASILAKGFLHYRVGFRPLSHSGTTLFSAPNRAVNVNRA